MRPSKLRLPLSTDATTSPRSRISADDLVGQRAAVADAGRAAVADEVEAELVEIRCRAPPRVRYSVTTFEPGARLVFTHGLRVSPRSTAFFASSPAPIITLGFEVFVQLVMAAITTAPCSSCVSAHRDGGAAGLTPRRRLHALLQLVERRGKRRLRVRQRHAVLRTPARPGSARPSRGRARACRCTSASGVRVGRGTAPAPSRTPRPARSARRRGR